MKKYIFNIVIEGKIPFLPVLKKIILFGALFPPIFVYFSPHEHVELGELGWNALLFLLFLRPLKDIFPEIKLFRTLLPLRKEIGILTGSLLLSHGWGYFLSYELPFFSEIFSSYFWNPREYFFWGALGGSIAFLLLITSNTYSMRLLKKWWKRLHRLSYLLFLVAFLHIVLIKYSFEKTLLSVEILATILPGVLLLLAWVLASLKAKIRFFQKEIQKKD